MLLVFLAIFKTTNVPKGYFETYLNLTFILGCFLKSRVSPSDACLVMI